ncbi:MULTISPECIES: SPW repeat protein [Actinomadura]|uniref:SPW repeat protein n=1 Tax=Actinomadura yumaensis TaxID=111807 RepID=A0ABW2CDX2_9ACTN|nr:SPW repeat protein [Actinomadura sp. J1-007]MWK38123.1 hypothetical protein [Actinomadura sp. J1-007]
MVRSAGIEEHPDIVGLRARYDAAAANPAVQLADGLTMLAGLYLAVSPWIIGFTGLDRLVVNNLVTGIAVAALALGFSSAFGHTHGIAWTLPVIGVWTIIAPWVIYGWSTGFDHDWVWSNVVAGAVITVMGLATMGTGVLGTRMMGRRMR